MMCNRLILLFGTFFYVGYSPIMPGTAGSFAALVMWWWLPITSLSLYIGLLLLFFFIGVWASTVIEKSSPSPDPSYIVIDEVVGMGVSLFFLPKTLFFYGMAFLVFRFFDIIKPFPINLIERKNKRGWSIMIDDVVAGIMTITSIFFLRWAIF